MASTNIARMAGQRGPRHPMLGTFGSAANQFFAFRTIVTRDAAGRAVSPSTADASGFPAMGLASHHLDNRTGSELGGAADAGNVEVEYGTAGLAYTGTAPLPGDVVYVVDNQTVSIDSLGGTRGIAGLCVETRANTSLPGDGPLAQCHVLMGPDVIGLIVAGQSPPIGIPLASFVDADGDPLAKFVSAASPTFGFNLADSEALNIRWNNDASPGTALCQFTLPADMDGHGLVFEFLCSKSGATVGDATTLTVTAFFVSAGDLHDADANAGGVSNALVGNAAAKTTALLKVAIAAADIPANTRTCTFTVTPTAGTLGTDDFMLHSVEVRKA